MNFATVEGLTIPEGAVTRIMDASGIVLWEALVALSGSYIIDQQKAYDALQAFVGVKTYTMSEVYGGGGVYTDTMTFDGTNHLIKYGDVVAFRSDSYMVEGNGFVLEEGARVNFYEGTKVSKEFYELFMSIVYDSSVITFTIEGATYQAKAGMSWAEWVVSDYNKDGFGISNGYFELSTYPIRNSSGVSQTATDTIVEGEAYAIDWGGSN